MQAVSVFGAVDILVNNAAFVHRPGVIEHFLEYNEASWRKTLDVNLTGMFSLLADCRPPHGETGARRGHHQCQQRWRFARASAYVWL